MTIYNKYVVVDDRTNEIIGATEGLMQALPGLRTYLRNHGMYDPNNLPTCAECGGDIGLERLKRVARGTRLRYCSAKCSGTVAKRRVTERNRARSGYIYTHWDGILYWW